MQIERYQTIRLSSTLPRPGDKALARERRGRELNI